jgi:hypothetical protein
MLIFINKYWKFFLLSHKNSGLKGLMSWLHGIWRIKFIEESWEQLFDFRWYGTSEYCRRLEGFISSHSQSNVEARREGRSRTGEKRTETKEKKVNTAESIWQIFIYDLLPQHRRVMCSVIRELRFACADLNRHFPSHLLTSHHSLKTLPSLPTSIPIDTT